MCTKYKFNKAYNYLILLISNSCEFMTSGAEKLDEQKQSPRGRGCWRKEA